MHGPVFIPSRCALDFALLVKIFRFSKRPLYLLRFSRRAYGRFLVVFFAEKSLDIDF
ncbi:hypothetical protein AB434_0200 [Heyndrickxia coagulans]|uniref:Uncharacterized protein n=1 Tax=Heyndrickxia coagulans TaxID=1398 RepID=A0AAN0T2V1_HEYCO|nr:hypothetical protein SB48_HM08orf01495 [Heyndrickxia coagulans]AKN52605.1 hypothetical protein AB434_0200 [Heyndrickxia coagulans]